MLRFGDPLQAYLSVGYVLGLRKPSFHKKMAHLRDQSAKQAWHFGQVYQLKLEPPLSFAGVLEKLHIHF
jgi:hypothetical protein